MVTRGEEEGALEWEEDAPEGEEEGALDWEKDEASESEEEDARERGKIFEGEWKDEGEGD